MKRLFIIAAVFSFGAAYSQEAAFFAIQPRIQHYIQRSKEEKTIKWLIGTVPGSAITTACFAFGGKPYSFLNYILVFRSGEGGYLS
ncbi:MAG: hypothetical protein WDO16_06130 [Bacteroidota bacterium]